MSSKKELWVLLAAFVLPITLGTVFFYWNPTVFTNTTVNYGEFVNPIIATEQQDVTFPQHAKSSLRGIWTLAYATERCDKACIQTLKNIKTIRILMNEDMRRIQRLLLTNNNTAIQEAGVLIARPSQSLRQKLGKFPNNSLFLIDPLGNVMLRYDPQTLDLKRVIKDLQRLFKYSRIG